MMLVQTLMAYASASSSVILGADTFTIRPFSSHRDTENLSIMCKDVWGGTDYLPSVASTFEKDPSCDFIIIENEKTGEMVAAGNRRLFDEETKSFWIESIRVSSNFQGRGIATLLMRELCRRSRESGAREILTCTSQSNDAMKKIFAKNGIELEYMHSAKFPDFSKLKELPGWAAGDNNVDDSQVENILKAYDLEHLISDEARSEKWETVKSEGELKSILNQARSHGMSGHIPGLGKLLWMSDELRESLKKGLVRKMCIENNAPPVIMALVKDPAIRSLRSKYVCSIMAVRAHDFDSALWEACKRDTVSLLDGNPSFCVMYDGDIPFDEGSSVESLPISKFAFVFYKWVQESNQ